GIVAEKLELELRLAEGVELLRVLPAAQLRHGGSGVKAAIGDVFVDEFRLLALELAIDLKPSARGHLAEVIVEGHSPDGAVHRETAKLVVDVHGGPHTVDRDAQHAILIVRADAARTEARAHADRGAAPAAVSLLREMIKQIEAADGYVRNDGSQLAEMREQLKDEADNYERKASNAEQQHQRKGAMQYSPTATRTAGFVAARRGPAPAPGCLIGLSHGAQNRRFQLFVDTSIGRSTDNEIPLYDDSLSRRHARILYIDNKFMLNDMGSTNGCQVNGHEVLAKNCELKHGDIVKLGFVQFRFEHD
ncbi:MAG TPA: FHA domain-containing protein, partial [Kofleriaceae bacterium]